MHLFLWRSYMFMRACKDVVWMQETKLHSDWLPQIVKKDKLSQHDLQNDVICCLVNIQIDNFYPHKSVQARVLHVFD